MITRPKSLGFDVIGGKKKPETHDKHTETHACDLISRQAAIDALKRAEALTHAFGYHNVIETIRELPSAQPDSSFITWLLDEIWDEDMWELNCVAFPEIVCRKLTKLGYVRERNGEYERLDKQTGDNERVR